MKLEWGLWIRLSIGSWMGFLDPFVKLRKWLLASSYPSVCSSASLFAWNNTTLTGLVFTKFGIWGFFENLPGKLQFHWNMIRMKGTSYEDLCTFILIFCWNHRGMRKLSDRKCRKNKTHFLFNKFFGKSCVFFEMMLKNIVGPDRPKMTKNA
jgi:hypothetical protein